MTELTLLLINTPIQIISDLTQQKKFNLFAVNTSSDALLLLKKSPLAFSGIIVNQQLSDTLCLNFIKTLQDHPLLKNIPTILIANRNATFETQHIIEQGIFDFIDEPFDTKLLTGILLRSMNFYKKSKMKMESLPLG